MNLLILCSDRLRCLLRQAVWRIVKSCMKDTEIFCGRSTPSWIYQSGIELRMTRLGGRDRRRERKGKGKMCFL